MTTPFYSLKKFSLTSVLVIAAVAISVQHAHGTYMATLDEIGGNVVGTGSGSVDTTGLTSDGSEVKLTGSVFSTFAALSLGPSVNPGTFSDVFQGITGPTNFGISPQFTIFADTGSGPFFGFNGFAHSIFLPKGYVSGTQLGTSTSTWNNATFQSLGLTTGTYVWTWGSGANADSLTLRIGFTNGVPESSSTILLMLGTIGVLAAVRYALVPRKS